MDSGQVKERKGERVGEELALNTETQVRGIRQVEEGKGRSKGKV